MRHLGLLLSPSQLDIFANCERKWAWRYIEKVRTPPTTSQDLGTRVHAQIERYFKQGTPLDLTKEEGKIAMSGWDLWPKSPTTAEAPFWFEFEGHRFYGIMDLPHYELIDGVRVPVVMDHKTTKEFGYALTPFTLRASSQGLIYAKAAMVATGSQMARLKWLYYRTTKPYKRHLVLVDLLRAEVDMGLRSRVLPLAERISAICRRPGVRALDLAPNASHCEAYGGCQYQNLCNLTPHERFHAIMTQQNLNEAAANGQSLTAMLETMKASTANVQQGQPPPPQGYPQQSPPPQGYPQQPLPLPYPQQPPPPQGYPQQSPPPQGYPQQQPPPLPYPQHGPQGPQHSPPPQGYPQQPPPPQGAQVHGPPQMDPPPGMQWSYFVDRGWIHVPIGQPQTFYPQQTPQQMPLGLNPPPPPSQGQSQAAEAQSTGKRAKKSKTEREIFLKQWRDLGEMMANQLFE